MRISSKLIVERKRESYYPKPCTSSGERICTYSPYVLPHLVHRIRQKKLLRKAYKHKLYALCKLSGGYDRFSKLFAHIRKSEYRSTVKAWEKAYILRYQKKILLRLYFFPINIHAIGDAMESENARSPHREKL